MSNPFEKILSGVMGKPASSAVVGLDIGSAFMKVVQLKRQASKAVLETYGEIALGPVAGLEVGQATNLPVEKLAETAKDLFAEAKITGKDFVVSLPLTSTMLTVIEMPDLGEAKLREMIPIEARRYIPTPVSEVALSHWVIPKIPRLYVDPDEAEKNKDAPPKVEVLLAAVHNDVLAKYNDITQKLGATEVSFEIEVFPTIRATIGHDASAIMLIDIGAASTKIVLLEEGVVRSSHAFSIGSQDITLALSRAKSISILEAEEMKRNYGLDGNPNDPALGEILRLGLERIFSEASRLMSKYQREKRVPITKVILAGGGSLMKGIIGVAAKSFDTEVVYGNAFEKVEAPAVLEPLLKDVGPEFAVSVGLALKKLGRY